MNKKLMSINLYGQKIGKIWWPPVECTKDFDEKFTPDDKPFTRQWSGLADALNFITNDGDFQGCKLSSLQGEAIYRLTANKVITIDLNFNPGCKLLKDYVYNTSGWLYVWSGEDD